MTVDEVLDAIADACAGFNNRALAVWGPVFHDALGRHEGERLAHAHAQVLITFDPIKRRVPYPVVSDYLGQVPNLSRDLSRASGGKALDRQGHTDRYHRLMDDWRQRQGHRVSNGVPEVMTTLELMAALIAGVQAWDEREGAPISLSAVEIKLAQHRAISQERLERFGPVHRQSAALWWQQITDVAQGWGIEALWDDWNERTSPFKKEHAVDADEPL